MVIISLLDIIGRRLDLFPMEERSEVISKLQKQIKQNTSLVR